MFRYSTCSVTIQENEWVVDYALRNRYVKVVDTGIPIGEEGFTKFENKRFNPNIKKTRRIFPHIHNMDGFYVCKLKKIKNGVRKNISEPEALAENEKNKPAKETVAVKATKDAAVVEEQDSKKVLLIFS